MLRNFLFLFGVLCAGLVHNASAQLVFVPDTNLRAYLDSVMPGVVDANGYIDSNGPQALGATQLTIGGAWTYMDLTGIEAFTNAIALVVTNNGEWGLVDTLNITAWPPNLQTLGIVNYFHITSLPPFPTSIEVIHLDDISGLTVVPALPPGLSDLTLAFLTDLTSVPVLPASLNYLRIDGCSSLVSLPTLPTQVGELVISELNVTGLPALPGIVTGHLWLDGMPALTELPTMPNKVGAGLELSYLLLVDTIYALPDSCDVLELWNMRPDLAILDWPMDITDLYVYDGGPDCFPPLPPTLETIQGNLGTATCFPPLPASMQFIAWGDGVGWLPNEAPICNVLNSTCDPLACGIGGRVFVDADADGIYDPGELPLTSSTVQPAPGNWLTSSDNNGNYNLGVQPGSYTITCSPNHPYVQSVAPAAHSAVFAQLNEVDTLNDFSVTLIPNVQDLTIDLFAPTPPVPGFNATYAITYNNAGTQVQDGTISLTHDALLTFASSFPAPTTINGTTLTWDFAQLPISASGLVIVHLSTPIGAVIGTPLTSSALVDPLATDQTPANNSVTFNHEVVAAWDPNDKAVSPTALTPTQVAAEERLTYTIRFQNTGTWPATRVVLTDTLSTDLQWNTMQEVAASHAHTWYIADGVLHVVFDNINLPDSNANEPESHGFFKFSMKPVSNLMLGNAVSNVANIYFDFNEPVITNAAVFTVDNNVGVAEAPRNGLHLSPNPTSEVLTVILDQPANRAALQVVDVTGRTVLSTTLSGTRLLLDVQALRPGSYAMRVGEEMVERFVKR